MEEVEYRTVLMDRADLRSALEQIERGLRETRDVMIEDRERYGGLLDFAAHVDAQAAHARRVLARTGTRDTQASRPTSGAAGSGEP